MLFNISGSEFLIILVIAMLVIGPQRLPEMASQLGQWVRKLKGYAEGMREQVRHELGPEFDEIEWEKYDPRQYDPRKIIRDALLDDTPTVNTNTSNDRPRNTPAPFDNEAT